MFFRMSVVFVLGAPLTVGMAAQTVDEYQLKAAFLYNFAKFVEWPESAFRGRKEFCIATLGRSPLDRELAALNGKTVNGRSIVFHQYNSQEESVKCQILFISRSELGKIEGVLDALKDLPVLTIADREDFCPKGGMLCIEKEGGKLVFDVNYGVALRARLKPSSQLLKLARRVYGRP